MEEEILDKTEALFERGTDEQILPKKVKLIGSQNKYIIIKPLIRAEVLEALSTVDKNGSTNIDTDKKIVLSNCLNPKFNEEEIKYAKHGYVQGNNLTIMETNELVQAWNEEQTQKNQQKKSVRHGNQITTQLL